MFSLKELILNEGKKFNIDKDFLAWGAWGIQLVGLDEARFFEVYQWGFFAIVGQIL
jgi:hypothetical protein